MLPPSSFGLLKDSSFGGCASYYEGSKLILLYNSRQKVGLPCASLKEGGLLMRRRTLPLLATTISLALLLVVGGVAASKQRHEEQSTSSQSATATKSAGDVSIQSTTVKASFASGSGADFLGVKISDHGNLLSFHSPA